MNAICFRRGYYYEFSNFFNCDVTWRGFTFGNTEAIFQCEKSMPDRFGINAEIMKSMSGREAKKYGRFNITLRPDWEEKKLDILLEILVQKFTQNDDLREILLGTTSKFIIEDTTGWHDNDYGRCTCPKCSVKPAGNYLGTSLMLARAFLRGEEDCVVHCTDKRDRTYEIDLKDEDSVRYSLDLMGVQSYPEFVRNLV